MGRFRFKNLGAVPVKRWIVTETTRKNVIFETKTHRLHEKNIEIKYYEIVN